jgi:lycopene beta-cyclase
VLDAVVVGGGASGLALVQRLALDGWADRQVLLVDDHRHPVSARSWACWSSRPVSPAPVATWSSLRVHADGRDIPVRLRDYRYHLVRGADLRRVVEAAVARAPGFVVRRGSVEAVRDRGDTAEVVVDGSVVRARWAFDSRPPDPGSSVDVWLSFHGWQVRTGTEAFDPSVSTLMDFRTPQRGEVRFVYVLPTGPREALVELTRFGAPGALDGSAELEGYLGSVIRPGSYEVVGEESGVLPLVAPPPRPRGGHVLPIGNRGGMLKASTGYAYARIQRDSAAVTTSLVRHGHPFDLPAPSVRHRFLDAALLDVVARDPRSVEPAFARLFSRNSGDMVLRFLDEATSRVQEARLVATLPRAPFLRAAARVRR